MTLNCTDCPNKPKARSIRDHNRLFRVIEAAFDQWPHGHYFQPNDAEHLRAWLLIRAGYCKTTHIELSDNPNLLDTQVQTAAAVARALPGHGMLRVRGDYLEIVSPRSLKFKELPQREFVPVREAVESVIYAETGMTVEQLLMAEAA